LPDGEADTSLTPTETFGMFEFVLFVVKFPEASGV